MPETQKRPLGNTAEPSVIQDNLAALFQFAHTHSIRNSFPSTKEGKPQDIVIVQHTSGVFICIKTSNGWFKTAALTAV